MNFNEVREVPGRDGTTGINTCVVEVSGFIMASVTKRTTNKHFCFGEQFCK